MFCSWEKFSQRVCHIQSRMYFANFLCLQCSARSYSSSHFQYVSKSRLRVIQIGVDACIDVTLYDELFFTSITEKYVLSPLRIILTVVQWSTPGSLLYPLAKLMVRYTIGLVHNIAYFIEPMTEAQGMTFHSLSIFCHGRVLCLTQLHTLQHRQELLLWLFNFELLQNLLKVCTHWKHIKRLDLSL